MALSINEANSVSHEYFDTALEQEIYQDSAFLAWLKSKGNITTCDGDTIQWPIRYKELDQTEAVTARQQIDFTSTETRTAASLPIRYVVGKTLIHWDEKIRNLSKSRIIDLIKDKTVELKEDFNEKIADQLWATTVGVNAIDSLPTIIDSTGTYAGISYADDTNWLATEDTTSTTMTLPLLQAARNSATFGKQHPTVHFTTRNLLSKFESILMPYVRYTSSDTQKMLDLGFDNVSFYGAPVVSDPKCVTAMWLGINMDVVELVASPDYNFVVSEWQDLFQAGFPHAMAKVMTFAGNLKFRNRKTHFKFTALDYTL